jgi:hypothetical protein
VVILVTNGRAKDSVVRQKVRFKGSLGLAEPLRARLEHRRLIFRAARSLAHFAPDLCAEVCHTS